MRPIQERLTMLAADLREDSRKAGIAAEQARPDVEDTAAVLATLQQTEADLNAQIDELERRLAETRRHILQAEAEHEQAKSVVKRHERDGQEAADMAARLDQLARGHRAPDDVPPAEALAATGLMVEPPKEVDPGPVSATLYQDNGLPMVWSDLDPPGGYVCAVYALAGPYITLPDGTRVCGNPVESEPCDRHGQPDDVPPAPREPVATPPVPTAPAPDMTMPDLGISPGPLPPATTTGEPRHAAPRDSTSTGRMRALGERIGIVHRDEQAGEQQGDA